VDGVRGFPTTVAELAAFDAIILSDIAAEAFTEKQLQWIDEWIGQRGGGLCMVGGEHSFASGGWDQTRLAAMLPVEMLPGGTDWSPGESIQVAAELPPTPHPLWNLVADEKQNRRSPPASRVGVNRWAGAAEPDDGARHDERRRRTVTAAPAGPSRCGASPTCFAINPPARHGNCKAYRGRRIKMPAIVAGRTPGRTLALAFPITSPTRTSCAEVGARQRQPLLRQVLP
jgi:hypothetical protein